MKIAATITDCVQVGQYEYRDVRTTKVFDSSQSIDDIMAWGNSLRGNKICFGDLLLSEVQEDNPATAEAGKE
jgi:hypothetical protein